MKRARLRRLPPPPRIRKSLLRERNAGDLAPLRLAVGVLWELRQHDHAAARSKRIGRRSSSHHRAVILHQGDLAHLRALRSPLFSEVARRVANLFAPPTMIDAGPLAGAHPCKVRRWASTKEILNQVLTRTAMNPRNAEVPRQTSRDRVSGLSRCAQCGGLCAKPRLLAISAPQNPAETFGRGRTGGGRGTGIQRSPRKPA